MRIRKAKRRVEADEQSVKKEQRVNDQGMSGHGQGRPKQNETIKLVIWIFSSQVQSKTSTGRTMIDAMKNERKMSE
jgi:hypothetical protein